MCQWKFLVFRYRANTSARMAFIAPAMSLVAERVRSVGIVSGASRFWRSSAVFVELFLFIFFVLSACFRRLIGRWPSGRGKNNFYLLRGNLFLAFRRKRHGLAKATAN